MMGMKMGPKLGLAKKAGPDRLATKAKILTDLMGFAGKGSAEHLKSKFAPKAAVLEVETEPVVEASEASEAPEAESELDLEKLDPEVLKRLLAELGQHEE